MGKTLFLSTFGAFRAKVGKKPLSGLSDGKMTALLVYLAMQAGRKLRRERLAGLFWPNLPAEAARFNLRHTFFHLRSALDGDAGARPFLLSNREWLCFNPDSPYRMDTVEFTAAVPACVETPYPQYCDPCLAKMEYMAGLYRGEFMAETFLPDCPDFEEWLQIQRESMRRHAITLLGRLSDCHEQAGAYTRALPFALRYAELEPWNEEAHLRAIRLFALDGQSGAALAQYEACCRALTRELGMMPGEKIRHLAERIRQGEWRPGGADAKGQPPLPFIPPLTAERRQVTALYCELIPLLETGPAATPPLLEIFQQHCIGIIRHFSGHPIQSHGGGLLAYFGHPASDEEAACRAVRAALACAGEAAPPIGARAGIHSGPVAADAAPGAPGTLGLTPSLAIRLRLGAKRGEVAISAETRRLVAGHFDCKRMKGQGLRDASHLLEAFKVKGERAVGKRAESPAMDERFGAFFADRDRIARRIIEDIAPRMTADPRYREMQKNDPDLAGREAEAVLIRIAESLLKDDTEFCRQLVLNDPFRRLVAGMVANHGDAEEASEDD